MYGIIEEIQKEKTIAHSVIVLCAALGGSILIYLVLYYFLKKVTSGYDTNRILLTKLGPPGLFSLITLFVLLVIPVLPLGDEKWVIWQIIVILLISFVAWLLIRLIRALRLITVERYDKQVQDTKARKVFTQIRILERLLIGLVVILAFSSVLMTFEKVREIGVSILASAGVAGVILGFAAQRSLANILAGIQIAFTQPIRLDDVVVVEGEWGKIEEITLTYVVICIWDRRRLVLPITYFIEKPFQNWTRDTSDILAPVYLYTDYRISFEALRRELLRTVWGTELWDRQVAILQVTNATEKTVEIRALVSAGDLQDAWDLKCLVREKLLTYIQEHHPGSLPHSRVILENPGQG